MTGSMQMLAGSGGASAQMPTALTANRSVTGANSTATLTFSNTGIVTHTNLAGAVITDYSWLVSGAPSQFDVMATLASGTAMSAGPAMGSWVNLASSQAWSQTQTVIGTRSGVLNISIRDAATLVVLATQTGTITADRN